jgi:hypothetical protein
MNKGFKVFFLLPTIVVVFAAGLLAGGCGSSSSAKTAPLTRDEFTHKGDQLCIAENKRTFHKLIAYAKRIHLSLGQIHADSVGAPYVIRQIVIPGYQNEIKKLRALPIPKGDGEKVHLILALMQERLTEGRRRPRLFLDTTSPFHGITGLAVMYGFEICGWNLTPSPPPNLGGYGKL